MRCIGCAPWSLARALEFVFDRRISKKQLLFVALGLLPIRQLRTNVRCQGTRDVLVRREHGLHRSYLWVIMLLLAQN